MKSSEKATERCPNERLATVELLIGGAKVVAIEKDTTAKITEVDYADVYFGTGSAGIDFEAVSDDLTIDISDKSRFRNISSVTGGTGNTLLNENTAIVLNNDEFYITPNIARRYFTIKNQLMQNLMYGTKCSCSDMKMRR